MVNEAADTAEMRDSRRDIEAAVGRVAGWLKGARAAIAFTGAGLSTSAGIGDYRGRKGKWTEMDRAEARQGTSDADPSGDDGVPYEALRPTFAHEAIALLLRRGRIAHVLTQNGDGLHELSGLPPESLSALHGNVFEERCEACHARFRRPFYTLHDAASQYWEEVSDGVPHTVPKPVNIPRCAQCGLSHGTGRACERCGGMLADTIINFGDDLEREVMEVAEQRAAAADLVLSVGTTMAVTPANSLVTRPHDPPRLVIVNRQETELDQAAARHGAVVHCDADAFFAALLPLVLDPRATTELEAGRPSRLREYDALRNRS